MGPCILEVHEICAILVKSMDSWLFGPNKFLSGEFRVFLRRNGHYWLWALPWKFGGKIKF